MSMSPSISKLEIVDYTPRHMPTLIPMWRKSFEEALGITDPHPIKDQIDYFIHEILPNYTVKVVEKDRSAVGFIAANKECLSQLYLEKSIQRKSVGKRLLDWAKENSNERLWLYAFDRNEGAKAFYESQGFIIESRGFEEHWQLADIKYVWTRE